MCEGLAKWRNDYILDKIWIIFWIETKLEFLEKSPGNLHFTSAI